MPFIGKGAIDPGPSTRTLRVDPDKVLALKAELQTIYDEVDEFLQFKAQAMVMRPLGADPVSRDTADAFNENTQSAIDASWGYHDELERVIAALDQAAKTYNLVEETHAQTFQRGVQ